MANKIIFFKILNSNMPFENLFYFLHGAKKKCFKFFLHITSLDKRKIMWVVKKRLDFLKSVIWELALVTKKKFKGRQKNKPR